MYYLEWYPIQYTRC